MNTIQHLLLGSWHWALSGSMIALVMFLMTWYGKGFGLSSTFRSICAILGGGKHAEFFRFDWRSQQWNLIFVAGIVAGGFLSSIFLVEDQVLCLSSETTAYLNYLGLDVEKVMRGQDIFLPAEIFGGPFLSWQNVLIIIGGGVLSGFGSRYAGGCTSGHFVSGMAHLQLPSFITVVFFILGGMLTTNVLLPWLLKL